MINNNIKTYTEFIKEQALGSFYWNCDAGAIDGCDDNCLDVLVYADEEDCDADGVDGDNKRVVSRAVVIDNLSDLCICDSSFGETFLGTREEFKVSMASLFVDWYADLDKTEDESTFEEFIEEKLDEGLCPASEEDVARFPMIGCLY